MGVLIPDNKGEHSSQPVEKLLAVLLVAVEQYLGIGICGEDMTLFHQFLSDILIVVYLTVEEQHL